MSRLTNDIVIAYGSTEVGYVTGGPVALGLTSPGAAGHVLPGAEFSVVDEAGNPVPEGAIGIIRFRTPGIAAGYLQHLDSKAFRDGSLSRRSWSASPR